MYRVNLETNGKTLGEALREKFIGTQYDTTIANDYVWGSYYPYVSSDGEIMDIEDSNEPTADTVIVYDEFVCHRRNAKKLAKKYGISEKQIAWKN